MKSMHNGNISEVNVEMQNNLTSQFQMEGMEGTLDIRAPAFTNTN